MKTNQLVERMPAGGGIFQDRLRWAAAIFTFHVGPYEIRLSPFDRQS